MHMMYLINVLRLIKSQSENEIIIQLLDPILSTYRIQYNKIDLSNNEKHQSEWSFDELKLDNAIRKECRAKFKAWLNNGDKVIMKRDNTIYHFYRYKTNDVFVKEEWLNVLMIGNAILYDIPEDLLEKINSATKVYILDWKPKIWEVFARKFHESETKISKIVWNKVTTIEDFILMSIFMNVLPNSLLSINRHKYNDFIDLNINSEIQYIKYIEITNSEIKIQLNQNLIL